MNLTTSERLRHVVRMRASFALEGLQPSKIDLLLLRNYVLGKISLKDMLSHAKEYAETAQRNIADI